MQKPSRGWTILLTIAGIHSCLLASYHFVLPYQWNWESGLRGVPSSIHWALYALNFSWSLLVFLTGAMVVRAAFLEPDAHRFARTFVFVIGLFWAIHGIYTVMNPLPMPRSLQVLKYALAVFPVIVVTLHWLPLLLYRRRAQPATT